VHADPNDNQKYDEQTEVSLHGFNNVGKENYKADYVFYETIVLAVFLMKGRWDF